MAEIAALGADTLLSTTVTDTHAVLRFHANADTRERLSAILAAESKYCAFLTMDLRSDGDALLLTIDGPPDAAPALRDLVDAFGETGAAA